MDLDLELYRQDVSVSHAPQVNLSVIDVAPEHPIQTLVMLHGFGGNATQWKYQISAFSDSCRCIAFDLRGHGRSDKPVSDYTVDEMVGDVSSALQALGVNEPVTLIGHSFGGALAATFAHRHPDRVGRLILVATTGEFIQPWYTKALVSLPIAALNVIRPFLRRQISAPPLVVKRYYQNALLKWIGWALMRELKAPTLVIRGDRDLLFPTADFERVAKVIPEAEEINVGVSAHMVLLERRDAVNRAIQRFLGAGAGTWRSGQPEAERKKMMEERPWLKAYDDGVPYTVSVPQRPLQTLLNSAARRFANRPATLFMGRALTYRQVERQSNRLANALRGMGVDKGVRVMILMPNLPQWVLAFYAVLKAGGIVVSSSPVSTRDELVREVKDSGAAILITITQFAEIARAALDETQLDNVIYTSIKDYLHWWQKIVYSITQEGKPGFAAPSPLRAQERMWVDLMKGYRPHAIKISVAPNSVAAIQYTGGTTDDPKGVMLSHRALVANAFQTRHWLPGLKEGREKMLCVVPFAHSYGLTGAMNTSIAMGAAMVILPNFVTEQVLKTIKRYRPTLFPGVPSMYVAINNFPGVRRYNVQSIRVCISGAAPLPLEVQETFEKLTRGRLVEGYGLTEASPVTHGNPLFGTRKTGSIGVPFPNTEARIVHLTTRKPVGVGEIGELLVRGPQIMDGYWRNDAATDEALRDGWLNTGDVAVMDADGFFQIVSRKKEMWYPERADKEPYPAFPRDVEEVIYEIPEVQEVAVMGVKQLAIAFITTRKPVEAGTITAFCARRLPKELVPTLVVFVDDLPKSFVGKILRRNLLDKIPEPQRKQLDIASDRIDKMLEMPETRRRRAG